MVFNFYGFLISLGILLSTFVSKKVKTSLPAKFSFLKLSVFDAFPWVIIFALLGARAYHVVDYWDYYAKDLIQALYLWQGGMGIFGGIVGGILGLWFFTLKNKLGKKEFLSFLDLIAISLPLGQAIGRWGNFLNQELYGLPTSLPWGIFIRFENRLPLWESFTHFHPLFLYESLGSFIIFAVLLYIIRSKFYRKYGFVFFLYLLLYSCLRFFLEFLRIESWQISGFRVNQLVSLGLMLVSIFSILKLNKS
ncbi:prolipoprotein diacylglyceryl transferase [Patescibacteria group bacterium]